MYSWFSHPTNNSFTIRWTKISRGIVSVRITNIWFRENLPIRACSSTSPCNTCKETLTEWVVLIILPFSILDLPFISAIVAYFIGWMAPSLAFLMIYLVPFLETYRMYKLPSRVIKMYSLLAKIHNYDMDKTKDVKLKSKLYSA